MARTFAALVAGALLLGASTASAVPLDITFSITSGSFDIGGTSQDPVTGTATFRFQNAVSLYSAPGLTATLLTLNLVGSTSTLIMLQPLLGVGNVTPAAMSFAPNTSQVFSANLGTFTLSFGGASAGVGAPSNPFTSFALTLAPYEGSAIDVAGQELSRTFVPEPSSGLLVAMGVVAAGWWPARRLARRR